MGQKGATNVFLLPLEKYVELSRDAQFMTTMGLLFFVVYNRDR